MGRSWRTGWAALVRPAMRVWERVPMRIQGRITVGLPLVAVVISAVLAVTGNSARVEVENDITRRFEMTVALGGLESLMVNAETGMRGYLLTGQREFLEPFDQAAGELPAAHARLAALASGEPGEVPRAVIVDRLRDIADLTDRQMADLTFQRDLVTAGGDPSGPEIRAHLAYGKGLMDRIRADVGGMQGAERSLLDDRIADMEAIRLRDYVAVVLALVAALATRFVAWYLFRNGIVRRVQRVTESLRGRRHGRPVALPPPTKSDQMGELEREVRLLDR